MPYQPCLMQLAGMLKQAAQDREATTEERQGLLEAIQSGSPSAAHQHLALQVGMRYMHRQHLTAFHWLIHAQTNSVISSVVPKITHDIFAPVELWQMGTYLQRRPSECSNCTLVVGIASG